MKSCMVNIKTLLSLYFIHSKTFMVMIKPPDFSLMQNFTVMNVYGMYDGHALQCFVQYHNTVYQDSATCNLAEPVLV